MQYYFAYGSNLHPVRLQARVPSARLVGVARLPGYRLSFDKLGGDGSGKCTITACGEQRVYGAVYTLDLSEKHHLDKAEGLGVRYLQHTLDVEGETQRYRVFTYIAAPAYQNGDLPPYTWYRDLVAEGARYLCLPGGYRSMLDSVPAVADPDPERARLNQGLVERCRAMNAEAFVLPE
ncbi:hypothetical protein CAI21_18285 [Alkalilimnicola ehrlichii]|uniref:Gamma-glutamylcyclotransferase AIG2-like domain-containing protein n=1 Tax=Alkalilimnicola ehrlichii TaxID=351052 RepID=A0A3E0WQ60_9GAMM|nr:gamma-glutamylcyclotransferase family protein [Alkalilimnicola ehrlichii]RFA25806.1 hypothetical protein CAI21_18285 [Alkalilimnicola ehrlichii]RFA35092.1 hypothetical protein CAL65_13355 [Alkalilimnicola ehrlichii]